MEAAESQQGNHYQLLQGDAALAPELHFLSVETVRVRLEGLAHSACAAEWNALLPCGSYQGLLALRPQPGAVLLAPEAPDLAAAAVAAAAQGARAVVFEAQQLERPFGYQEVAPAIPACMVSSAVAHSLRQSLGVEVCVELLAQEAPEEERDVEEGLVSAFIANDAVDTALHRELKGLRTERERCERSLRFAHEMRQLLERRRRHVLSPDFIRFQ